MERNVQSVTSGGTRIYQTGDANSSGWGTNLLFGKIFTDTCLKRKEIGRDGGTWIASAPPPLDSPMVTVAAVITVLKCWPAWCRIWPVASKDAQNSVDLKILRNIRMSKAGWRASEYSCVIESTSEEDGARKSNLSNCLLRIRLAGLLRIGSNHRPLK